jgi:hypothetical protein
MSIVERARNMIVSPRQEWEVIRGERPTVADLYTGYVIPLAAIGPVATLIGQLVFGVPTIFGTFRPSPLTLVIQAIVTFLLMLAVVYVVALIVDALAPSFAGQKNQIRALQVVAYGSTASWLAGIFSIVPVLGILAILGLYSLYLFYLGLPVLMDTPPDRALVYTIVVVVAAVVAFVVVGIIAGLLVAVPGAAFM